MKADMEVTEIIQYNSEKMNSLCRICLSENIAGSVSLFDKQDLMPLFQRVMLCARVQINHEDGLPAIICLNCSKDLEIADHFRIKCEYSDSLLRRAYAAELSKVDVQLKEEPVISKDEPKPEEVINELPIVLEQDIKEELPEAESDDNFDRDVPFEVLKKEKKRKSKKSDGETSDLGLLLGDVTLEVLACNINDRNEIKKRIVCLICNKYFKRKYMLKEHVKTEHKRVKNSEKKFQCIECDYKTPYKKTLIYHIRTHTGEKPYICDVCNRGFAQPSSLISHKKTHSDRMYYTCPQCGRQFKYKQKYERHKSVHDKEKKFPCTICNKGLKSKLTLQIHMNRHYNIKNYSCETCGSTFVTSSELINHSKIHTDQKNFCCNICEFKTYKKTGLEKHLKHHSGERPFKCEFCEMAYCTRGELKCHLRKHTKEKNYSCPVCTQKFIHSPSLNRHMLKVHGVKFKWSNFVDRRIVK